jgi:DNA-binding response OmpR family regulator
MLQSRVLFISPNKDAAQRLERILYDLSLPLDVASDFREALERARENSYSLLITETTLPDAAWGDVLALARRRKGFPPLIVTSLHADARFWVEALDAGAADVLRQPFDHREVEQAVTAVLDAQAHALAV